ncbi:hypothetical protein JCM3770_001509 [Rhodotorula araucariae]
MPTESPPCAQRPRAPPRLVASLRSASSSSSLSLSLPAPALSDALDALPHSHSHSHTDRTPSRTSSSSSLDGLAARLRGARASARRSKGKGKPATLPSTPAADPPSPTKVHRSPSPSTSYDLARLSPDPTRSRAASPPNQAAFQREPSPSSFVHESADDEDEEEEEDDAASSLVSVARSDAHDDPRLLLRAQLVRAPPSERIRDDHLQPQAPDKAVEDEKRIVPPRELLKRRYFILSTAGKLVYTSDEDEEAATGLVGVMQAIVSIFADEGDKLRYVDAHSTRISFLLKAPLYLVVVSSLGEPESVLRMHLDYLYLQVLSVVTLAQLQAIFARRSNFDLRRMLEGTEPFFESLVTALQTSFPILLSSIEVYRLAPAVRAELALALDPGKEAVRALDLLYILLVCNGRLVTLLRPKKHSIHPTDLHLLLSTIYAPRPSPSGVRPSPLSAPGAETWLPVCLPRFNARGFLHTYIAFLDGPSAGTGAGAGIVLVSSQRDALPGVRAATGAIRARLEAGDALHALEMARAAQAYSLGELAVPGVRHFVYKDRGLVQVTASRWEGEYDEGAGADGEQARMRLIALYQHLHDALHPRPAAAGSAFRPPAQVQYLRTEHEAVLGWVTPQFELYLATAPLLPHSAVVSAARAVSRWVRKEERGLFLHGAGTF